MDLTLAAKCRRLDKTLREAHESMRQASEQCPPALLPEIEKIAKRILELRELLLNMGAADLVKQ